MFATKNEHVPSIDEYLGDMVDHLSEHPLDELVVVREKSFEPEANWKLLMENFMEYYHLPAVHPELCLVSGVEERTSCLFFLSPSLSFTYTTTRNNNRLESPRKGYERWIYHVSNDTRWNTY